ncbi:MAG: serine hydrolase [Bacteroidetes bacterium]|nr:serine hydrolase [Bacteroidota bacterium]
MIRVLSDKDDAYYREILKLTCDYKVGGVCFFKGSSPLKQAKLTNTLQGMLDIPMLISIDGEWGLGMRLDSTISFPRQMTLGAVQYDSLIYKMGVEIGNECKRIGINVNFAPVIDINSNPANPVINIRSFGENKYKVAKKGIAYMKGMQDVGVLACGKHFPGHGDTDTDSHLALPIINHSYEIIDTLDLYPFKELMKNGLGSVMVAHLHIPSLDTTKNSASTLSKKIVTGLLKEKLGFKGFVFTDALDMKGVSKYNKPGFIELKALMAGNDILLLPQNVPAAVTEIQKAIDDGVISSKLVEEKCKKQLLYKKQLGLNKFIPVKLENLYSDLNSPEANLLQQQLYENAITVVKNNNEIIPLKNIEIQKLAFLSIGDTLPKTFQNYLCNYATLDAFNISKLPKKELADSMQNLLSKYDLIIIGLHNTNIFANKQFGITQPSIDFIDSLSKKSKIILDIFANPYCLPRFTGIKNIEAMLISYQDNQFAGKISAEIIFGAVGAKGKLPITACVEYPINTGFETKSGFRLKYSLPEELNISSKKLAKIDSIVNSAILAKAFPGCQILAVKDGKIFYQKSFGFHTYENKTPVKDNDLYDLASVTKIVATTISAMNLYDKKKLDLDKKLERYLPYFSGTNKADLLIRDVLTHQAKLKAWIPFYKSTIKEGKVDTNIYKKVYSKGFPNRVADSLYMSEAYIDTIMKTIIESPLQKAKEYLYSDLGFYIMRKVVETITNKKLDEYADLRFYKPLGMTTTCFQPRNKFDLSRIIPTEVDNEFRKQTIWGDVNDQGAAMLGGVSGHAGLFSSANDLAKLFQMLLQGGEYAGKKYLNKSTITEWTKCQFPENNNRRGLGFDKPGLSGKGSPACKSVSPESYGHSGFTGTYFWVDPKENLIYIFLSNRTYPDPNNFKITEMNIRTNIHEVIYDALKNAK